MSQTGNRKRPDAWEVPQLPKWRDILTPDHFFKALSPLFWVREGDVTFVQKRGYPSYALCCYKSARITFGWAIITMELMLTDLHKREVLLHPAGISRS